jgi:hydrogenase nickel incorporation protein HypA/HybF
VHEFGVAASVLDAVEARAAGRPVSALRLHVGALHRLDRAVFDDAFSMVADGGVAEGAVVEVVEIAVAVRCRGCTSTTTADELVVGCATCGAHDLELLSGDELVLESITVSTRTEQEVG